MAWRVLLGISLTSLGAGMGTPAAIALQSCLPSSTALTMAAPWEVPVGGSEQESPREAVDSAIAPLPLENRPSLEDPIPGTGLGMSMPRLPSTPAQGGETGAIAEGFVADAEAIANPGVDIDPQILEESPVLRRWLEEIPDVATDIKYDPAFRTRLRAGYAFFPSNNQTSGFQVGVQDVFVGRTPLTFSADYYQNGRGDRSGYGVEAQYYILPLGWYGNVAPVVGYRHLETSLYTVSGVNVGFRIVLIPSRMGGADIAFTQTWVAPGTADEVGLTTLSFGYAITARLRLSTDIQTQNTNIRQDSRVGLLLEWLP